MPTSAAAYRPQAQPLPSSQVSSHPVWLLSWLLRLCLAIDSRQRSGALAVQLLECRLSRLMPPCCWPGCPGTWLCQPGLS